MLKGYRCLKKVIHQIEKNQLRKCPYEQALRQNLSWFCLNDTQREKPCFTHFIVEEFSEVEACFSAFSNVSKIN